MAGNEASFIVRLIDKITRPARQAMKAMGGLQQQIQQVEKATKPATRSMRGMSLAGSIMGNTLGGLAANAVTRLASGVLELGEGLVSTTLGAVDFTQRMGLGFQSVAKHGASGAKLFQHVRDEAVRLGLGVQDTSQQFLKFLSLGFNPKMATDLIRMGSDMRLFGATGEDITRIYSQLGQIMSKGKLQGEELIVLAENGISTQFVYDALGKQLGKTRDEILKMQQAGKLTSDMALPAIMQAVLRQTGSSKLGEAGQRIADTTLGGMRGRLGAQWEEMWLKIAPRIEGPLVQALSPIGTAIMSALGSSSVVDSLVLAISGISRAIQAAGPAVRAFGQGVMKGLGSSVGGAATNFESFIKQLSSPEFVAAMQSWGDRLGVVLSAIVSLTGAAFALVPAFVRMLDVVQKPFDVVRSAAAALIESAAKWGPDIVRGFVDGIMGAISLVQGAAKNLASAFKLGVSGELAIHSPSKVMEQLGGFATAGFIVGVQAPMRELEAAGVSMGAALTGAVGSSAMALSSGGGGQVLHFSPTVTIQATQAPGESSGAFAERIFDDFEDRMSDMFARLVLEVA